MEPSSSKPTESLLTQFAKSLGLFPFDLEGQSFPLTIGQSILEFINNGKTTADNFILGYDFKPASAIAAADAGVLSTLTFGAPTSSNSELPNAQLTTPGATPDAPSSSFEGNALAPKAGVCECLLVFDRATRTFRLELVRHTFKLKCKRGAGSSGVSARARAAPKADTTAASKATRSPQKRRSPAKGKAKSPGKKSRILQQSTAGSSSSTLLAVARATATASVSSASNSFTPNPIMVAAATAEGSAHALSLMSSSLSGPKHSRLSESSDEHENEDEDKPLLVVAPLPSSALLETVAHEMHLLSDSPDRHAPYETLTVSSSTQLNHSGSPELRLLTVDQVAHDLELSPTSSPFSPQSPESSQGELVIAGPSPSPSPSLMLEAPVTPLKSASDADAGDADCALRRRHSPRLSSRRASRQSRTLSSSSAASATSLATATATAIALSEWHQSAASASASSTAAAAEPSAAASSTERGTRHSRTTSSSSTTVTAAPSTAAATATRAQRVPSTTALERSTRLSSPPTRTRLSSDGNTRSSAATVRETRHHCAGAAIEPSPRAGAQAGAAAKSSASRPVKKYAVAKRAASRGSRRVGAAAAIIASRRARLH